MANRAYKFRIYPTSEQQTLFAKTFGCVRFVYNYWLNRRIEQYNTDKTFVSYSKCSEELTQIKKKDKYVFLKEVDSISLQQSLRHLDAAFKSFFELPKSGFPKYKSKHRSKKSYSTVCVNGNISISEGFVTLPKVGAVKLKQHRRIPSDYKLKSVTVSRSPSGKYYASILFEYDNVVTPAALNNFLGLDYSMPELYTDSDGREPNYPKFYRKAEKKLAVEQRKLSKMKKGSNNRKKQIIKVAKLHEKVANQRKDFLHKQSRQIANAYDCVCIEDLDMKAMSQALNFGKSVADNGWGMFISYLTYKLEEQGKKLIKVDKFFPSSQTCSCCGYVNKETKKLSVRAWDCPQCGAHHNRDINAAINIKNEGMRLALA